MLNTPLHFALSDTLKESTNENSLTRCTLDMVWEMWLIQLIQWFLLQTKLEKWPLQCHTCWLTYCTRVSLYKWLIEIPFFVCIIPNLLCLNRMRGCTPIYSTPKCTTSGEFAWLPVDYLNIIYSPSSFFFFFFLWLSAVRVHTHPWAKESKIDHTSNWSRCTGTGSSSRADLSHAGKIMHPELTAQHTRLPSTSFLKCSRNFTLGRKQGGGEYCDSTLTCP